MTPQFQISDMEKCALNGAEDHSDVLMAGNPCFQCRGKGIVSKKRKNENPNRKIEKQGKWLHVDERCPSCSGTGSIKRTRRTNSDGSYRKKVLTKSYPSFVAPGPHPACPHLQPGPDEELSYLAGNWKIFQKLDRHRYSTDDLCTSFYACQTVRLLGYESPLVLDIGCGLGSVLLTNAWQLPSATCVGIEAQRDRYELAVRSVEYNTGCAVAGQAERVKVIHGDLREVNPVAERKTETETVHLGYDLVTGTPPYFPPATAAATCCVESSGCLLELRGGVEEYCQAAKRSLRAPGPRGKDEKPSVFVVCNTALASARVYSGCSAAGLSVVRRVDVVPRQGKPALFCVFVAVLDEWLEVDACKEVSVFPALAPRTDGEGGLDVTVCPSEYRVLGSVRGEVVETLTVRERVSHSEADHHKRRLGGGGHTLEYQRILRHLGKPCSEDREEYDLGVTESV